MNTKKNIVKFVLIILIMIVLAAAVKFAADKLFESDLFTDEEWIGNGITVTDSEGERISQTGIDPSYLHIDTDNVVVSGTATNDIYIDVGSEVSNITISDLDQGDYEIEMELPLSSDCKVTFKGTNEISYLCSFKNLTLCAPSLEDELTVTNGIDVEGKNFDIRGGTIISEYLWAMNDMNISGETAICLKKINGAAEDESSFARLDVCGKLNIDLSGKGGISILDANDELWTMSATKALVLGENTSIVFPENVNIKASDIFGEEYTVFSKEGTSPDKIEIKCIE